MTRWLVHRHALLKLKTGQIPANSFSPFRFS